MSLNTGTLVAQEVDMNSSLELVSATSWMLGLVTPACAPGALRLKLTRAGPRLSNMSGSESSMEGGWGEVYTGDSLARVALNWSRLLWTRHFSSLLSAPRLRSSVKLLLLIMALAVWADTVCLRALAEREGRPGLRSI